MVLPDFCVRVVEGNGRSLPSPVKFLSSSRIAHAWARRKAARRDTCRSASVQSRPEQRHLT
jgi:hypothetical protein